MSAGYSANRFEPDAEGILQSISDAIFAIDEEWCFRYGNNEAERLLGQPREAWISRNIWDYFPPSLEIFLQEQFSLARETGFPVRFEANYPGRNRWFEVRAFPGEHALTVCFRDITDYRGEEEFHRISRGRLDLALRSVDLGLWYCDLPFDKLVWNKKTKEHFFLDEDAEVDINLFFDRLHPDDREPTRAAIETAVETRETFDTQYRTVAPDGRMKWIRAIGKPFYDSEGTPVRFDGITVDTTEQKQLLAQEQESRIEAETLNRIGRALSAELDLEKLVQMITDAATELTHAQFGAFFYNVRNQEGESYTLYTISGVPREAFSNFPMPRNTAVFAPTFRGEGVVRSDDITQDPRYGKNAPRLGMPPGHLPVRSYLAVPVISRSGDVIGGLLFGHSQPGVFQDTHERIVTTLASQAAIAMDNAKLFIAAERARSEAQESAAAVQKANAELQQVAYVAAHDLQEPLRTIASFSQLLERRFRGRVDDSSDDLVDRIVEAATRMHTLLNNLLEYIYLGSEEARPSGPVALNQVVASVIDELTPLIEAKNGVIQVDPLPTVGRANRKQIKQLFSNLLVNALKYSRLGVRPEISISWSPEASMCHLWVRDNGEGFDPQYAKQIFGMFKRLHGREVPGTGIGLALCKRIVEVHGGTIWAESSPGQGSTIHFTLPFPSEPS